MYQSVGKNLKKDVKKDIIKLYKQKCDPIAERILIVVFLKNFSTIQNEEVTRFCPKNIPPAAIRRVDK